MNFLKYRWIYLGITVFVIAASVTLLFVNPYNQWGAKSGSALNLGVDFTGGSKIYFPVAAPVQSAEVTKILQGIDLPDFKFNPPQPNQYMDSSGRMRYQVLIYTSFLNDTEQEVVLKTLEDKLGAAEEGQGLDITRVAPLIGAELLQNALKAILIAVVLMLVYIAFRFEFVSGIAAIVALMHDSIIVLGFFALLGLEMNATMIAAILTVIGYSINDTIVVFDRIRENQRSKHRGTSYVEMVNDSILQTFRRSLNTSATTILSILVLFVLVPTIREFCFAMIVGMTAGTYSSLFVAAPAWAVYKDWQAGKQLAAKRA